MGVREVGQCLVGVLKGPTPLALKEQAMKAQEWVNRFADVYNEETGRVLAIGEKQHLKSAYQEGYLAATDQRRIKELKQALWSLDLDNHYWSKRPCQTCREITELLRAPFGCNKKAGE